MVQNSLGSTVRWILLVCSLFLMFSQQPHAEQHVILVGVRDYENPNLQLDAPPNDLKLMEAVLSAHGVAQGRYPDRNDEAFLWMRTWHHRRRTCSMMNSTPYSKNFRRGRFPALSTHATPATYSERFV